MNPTVPGSVDGRARQRTAGLAVRVAIVSSLLAASMALGAGAASAAPNAWDGAGPAAGAGGGGRGGGGGNGGGSPSASRGYDISWPQCGGAYPKDPAFGIVGVNGGRVYSANPCLASQISWAGGEAGELYVNTGNPGPELSSFWPVGQASPRFCDPADPDTADCAYDYGWNAAAYSWDTARTAYAQLGLADSPAATTWWLDVETSNSWRTDTALNVAAIRGQVDYLLSVGITSLGFYSTQQQWDEITGGTHEFSAYPSWLAGALSLKGARDRCSRPSFTGGQRVVMTQYPYAGYDANLRC